MHAEYLSATMPQYSVRATAHFRCGFSQQHTRNKVFFFGLRAHASKFIPTTSEYLYTKPIRHPNLDNEKSPGSECQQTAQLKEAPENDFKTRSRCHSSFAIQPVGTSTHYVVRAEWIGKETTTETCERSHHGLWLMAHGSWLNPLVP